MRTVVLTVSTSVSRREAEDASGPLLAHLADDAGAEIVAMEVVPDDFALIEDRLHHYVDDGVSFIFTTGGTGLTPDDVTPEATRAVIEREAQERDVPRGRVVRQTSEWNGCSDAATRARVGVQSVHLVLLTELRVTRS